jgi:hypothetical protein
VPQSDRHCDDGLAPDRAGCRELPDLHRTGATAVLNASMDGSMVVPSPTLDHAFQRGRTLDIVPQMGSNAESSQRCENGSAGPQILAQASTHSSNPLSRLRNLEGDRRLQLQQGPLSETQERPFNLRYKKCRYYRRQFISCEDNFLRPPSAAVAVTPTRLPLLRLWRRPRCRCQPQGPVTIFLRIMRPPPRLQSARLLKHSP